MKTSISHNKEKSPEAAAGLYQVSQKVLFYREEDKKFLLVRSAYKEGTFYKNYGPWDLIGGRVDQGEDMNGSLNREVVEEAGQDVRYELVCPLDRVEMEYASGKVVTIGFLALYQGGEVSLSEGEHDEYRWETAEEVEKNEEYKPWLKQFVKAAAERLKEREYLNDLKRLQADFDNYRRRQQESQKELGAYLIEKLVMDLIPVLDNFRSATQHVPESSKTDPWVVGIQYIEKQLEDVLAANGMQTLEVKEGDVFDPRLHEAIGQDENETEGPEKGTTITKVLQKGYKVGDRVVRPAKVVVS
jgi:molecular chaperone GrpE